MTNEGGFGFQKNVYRTTMLPIKNLYQKNGGYLFIELNLNRIFLTPL